MFSSTLSVQFKSIPTKIVELETAKFSNLFAMKNNFLIIFLLMTFYSLHSFTQIYKITKTDIFLPSYVVSPLYNNLLKTFF